MLSIETLSSTRTSEFTSTYPFERVSPNLTCPDEKYFCIADIFQKFQLVHLETYSESEADIH